jgi:hypothetical protein
MFQPLGGHPQAINTHKIKITIARTFLYGYTETSIFVLQTYTRSVRKDAKQFKQIVFSIILELLGFVHLEVLLSTFYTELPVNFL